jgi:hypothetical protein
VVYCKKCAKKHYCKAVDKSQYIDCESYREDLDFLQDEEDDFLLEMGDKKDGNIRTRDL